MKSDNLISVILPVFNGEKFIKEALLSLLTQTYSDYEIILLDDGSVDNTLNIVKEFKDNRIKLCQYEHKGLIHQLNKGVTLAEGKYIARMDADDLSLPERFKYQIDYLKKDDRTGLVGTNFYHINEKGNLLEKKSMPELHHDIEYMMPITASVLHPTIMTYKSILQKYKYDETKLYSEDHALFLTLLSNGIKMYNIQESLFKYRVWSGSSAFKTREIQKKNVYNEGLNYIIENYSDPSASFDYYIRRGILEYYRGSMHKSRKYLIEAFRIDHGKWKTIIRYLPLTLLGDPIIKMLRENSVLPLLSRGINKLTGNDLNIVKKNE